MSVGVNWYLVDPLDVEKRSNGTYKQKAGKYLSGKYRECDKALSDTLTSIAKSDDRSVKALEQADLIPGARYYSEPVTVAGRTEWHQRALAALAGVDVVFLDPDNEMLVNSVKPLEYDIFTDIEFNHRKSK